MSSPTAAERSLPSGSPRVRASRWAVVFVAVIALHWLAAEWIAHHRELPQPTTPTHIPVQIVLLKPQHIERSAPPPAARTGPHAAPHPAAREHEPHTLRAISSAPHPKVPARPASNLPAEPASAAASAPVAASSAAPTASAAPAASAAGPASPASAAAGNGNGAASHGVKFSVPPSGDLQYNTFYNGMQNQPGTIHWSSDSQHYEMVVSVPMPFIGTFSWSSHGHIDAFGLAPDQYIEKRGHRPEDVTIFNRTERQIVFTRTPNSLALPDGAEDRFSVVMQLASLVRGDPDAYKPGVTREFYVADNDSGETWPVTTIGDESVSTDHGFVTARHFMRLPRHEGDRRRIDVWLAPSLGWLPVRLVQTEPNGSQFELVWRGPLSLPENGNGTSPAHGPAGDDTGIAADDHGEANGAQSGSAAPAPSASPSPAAPASSARSDTTPGEPAAPGSSAASGVDATPGPVSPASSAPAGPQPAPEQPASAPTP